MTLKRDWEALDGSVNPQTGDRKAVIPEGRHEIERVPNPYAATRGFSAPWLVLKGTLIGGTEGSWRQWTNGVLGGNDKPIDWGKFEVIIED